jgi:hypothetical protein
MLKSIYIYKGKHPHIVHQGNTLSSIAGNTSTTIALVPIYPSTLEGRKKGCSIFHAVGGDAWKSSNKTREAKLQTHFYIQGVSKMLRQISRLSCSHQNKENCSCKRIPGNYCFLSSIALLHSTMCWDSTITITTCYELDGPGDRIPVGSRYSTPVQTSPGAHPASYTMGTGSFPGEKQPGRCVKHLPHLAPRLKKEYSYTSTLSTGLRGLF